MMRLVLITLGMLLAQPVSAEWVEVTTSNKHTSYVDPATVRKTVNGRRSWTIKNFYKPQRAGSATYISLKVLDEFNCEDEKSRALQIIAFSGPMGTGDVISSDNQIDSWSVVPPESIAEDMLKFVCRLPVK
jgi:hypothetical protein